MWKHLWHLFFPPAAHKPAPAGAKVQIDPELGDVSVSGSDFSSPLSRTSPNGDYLVAYHEEAGATAPEGTPGLKNGAFILAYRQRLLFENRQLERPAEVAVANNGHVVINDWRFDARQLRGDFYAFNPQGEILIHKAFSANLLGNAISPEGRFALCACANHPIHEDGGTVAFFDLQERVCLWQKVLVTGPLAKSYAISEQQRQFTVTYVDGRRYRYDFEGNLLERVQLTSEQLKNMSISALLGDYQREFRALNAPALDRVAPLVQGLLELLARNQHPDPAGRASALRLLGEIHEACAAFEQALDYYEQALGEDEKVGVKRKIQQLRRRLHS